MTIHPDYRDALAVRPDALGRGSAVAFEVLPDDEAVIARLPPLTSLKEGVRISLAVDPEKMHLFDAETERLIDPRA